MDFFEPKAQILKCGDSAVAVQFGETADIKTNLKVRALDAALSQNKIHGVVETIPTYRSEMIHYNPLIIRYRDLCAEITSMLSQVNWDSIQPNNEVVVIPIFYKDPKCEMPAVADYEHITVEEAIQIHTNRDHYAFMMGVSPGTVYLNSPTGSFTIPRKSVSVPKPYDSSVQIWSTHTTIGAFPTQSGWWVIGRAPVPSYNPRRPEDPFLVKPGQWVRFRAIGQDEFEHLEEEYRKDRYERELIYRKLEDLPL